MPRKLESQLKIFRDKVEGKEPAGGIAGSTPVGPKATFCVRKFLRYGRQFTFPLVDEVAPVEAVISDRGDSLSRSTIGSTEDMAIQWLSSIAPTATWFVVSG